MLHTPQKRKLYFGHRAFYCNKLFKITLNFPINNFHIYFIFIFKILKYLLLVFTRSSTQEVRVLIQVIKGKHQYTKTVKTTLKTNATLNTFEEENTKYLKVENT